RLEVADIGGQDSVHVTLPVGAREGEESAEIRVHEGHSFAQSRVLRSEVPEARRQQRAKIFANRCARGSVQVKQGRFERDFWIGSPKLQYHHKRTNLCALGGTATLGFPVSPAKTVRGQPR